MNNTEPKIIITRSFSRKLNIGNFENIDLLASYTEAIFDDEYTEAQIENLSKTLYEKAKRDVENAAVEFKNERVKRQDKLIDETNEAETDIGLQLEKEDEEDEIKKEVDDAMTRLKNARSKKLEEANKSLGLK